MYQSGSGIVTAEHYSLGKFHLYCLSSPHPVDSLGQEVQADTEEESVIPDLLFTENNTNLHRLYGGQNETPFVKDAFHDHIIPDHHPPDTDGFFGAKIHNQTSPYHTFPSGRADGGGSDMLSPEKDQGACTPFPSTPSFVNPEKKGTKSAAHYVFRNVPGHGGCAVVRLKITPREPFEDPSVDDEDIFDNNLEERRGEADEFYNGLIVGPISDDFRQIMRQAFGGMLWSKQFYQFIPKLWLDGDPKQPPPPLERRNIRNNVPSFWSTLLRLILLTRSHQEWTHMYAAHIFSTPDKYIFSSLLDNCILTAPN
jgi:hypothetical protein